MNNTTDVIVVDLGAVGSAALYQRARGGISAIGIDRWEPPHAMGSSQGETRITRQAIGEGEVYVPLVPRSHEIWRELEQDTGQRLFEACGVLIIGAEGGAAMHHSRSGCVLNTIAAAQAHGIDHEVLSVEDTRRRFPQFALTGDELVYFEPGGGFVYPERCIAAQLAMAQRLGARMVTGAQVTAITEVPDGVAVTAGGTTYHAGRVILAAGAWTPGLALPPVRSAACLFTCAPDADFVIGPLDGSQRITVVSACSGHGFKHSAAVGEHDVRPVTKGPAPAIPALDPRRLTESVRT
jgi:sarcosine oxidase